MKYEYRQCGSRISSRTHFEQSPQADSHTQRKSDSRSCRVEHVEVAGFSPHMALKAPAAA
jgi:hypothetical protein